MNFKFCTLFNFNYLSRGVALIESFQKCYPDGYLYILAMDKKTEEVLNNLKFKNSTIISLNEFETNDLKIIKYQRSTAEYCWTCTPEIIKYCIEKYGLDSCTYLDADLYFFNNPNQLIEELKINSVLITEHRYTRKYDQTQVSGRFCVQFMTFKNDEFGLRTLNWWNERCLEWCFARPENGKFGDQKYLDVWPELFDKVHILEHIGGGVAPWNMTQYQYRLENNQVILNSNGKDYPLVFFHFHALKIYDDKYDLGIYEINDDIVNLIYKPYLKHLEQVDKKLRDLGYDFNWHAKSPFDTSIKGKFSRFKRILKRCLHIITKEELGIYG